MRRAITTSGSIPSGASSAAGPDGGERAGVPELAVRESRDTLLDAWLTARTTIALLGDERLRSARIDVVTADGDMTLRGTVDSEEARRAAIEIALRVVGVVSVTADLQIEEVRGAGVRSVQNELAIELLGGAARP